jgi:hypothetical protein
MNRLCRLGLVVRCGTSVRANRERTLYRSAAREFILPLPLIEQFMLDAERQGQSLFLASFGEALLDYHYSTEPIAVRVWRGEDHTWPHG